MRAVLLCSVRGCGGVLERSEGAWTCPRGHAFDVRRSGALNLLQPQDRRSKAPGDAKETALARRRLSEKGFADAVHGALAEMIAGRSAGKAATLLDVGCGEGAFLRSLAHMENLERHGLDLSTPSIDLAARASPEVLFLVANADRALPYGDRSFDIVTALDSRLNAAEFDRVLSRGGLLLAAVAGPDDLIELRERLQGSRLEKSRTPRLEEQLEARFALKAQMTVRETRRLGPEELRDFLTATYRGFRRREREAVETLTDMSVTLSHDIMAFEPRP